MIDRNAAMKNEEFRANVMDAYYSQRTISTPNMSDEDLAKDVELFLDNNWDSLVDEYWIN